jgi:hypothetical protein
MFEGRTELQVQSLLRSEIGKWMIVEDAVRAVSPVGDMRAMVAMMPAGAKHVFCSFNPVPDALMQLTDGDIAKIEGRIDQIQTLGIFLSECELISSRRALASPPS